MEFQQEDFTYNDLFLENRFLKNIIKHYARPEFSKQIEADVAQFSSKIQTEVQPLMVRAETHQPTLKQYDHWGDRIDEIKVDPSWNELHQVAARESLIGTGYRRDSGAYSRLHQFLKILIFHPSSAFYTCPLAMTDGAARVLELEGGPLKEKYFAKLIGENKDEFWTAGQWMTEKAGGSDVSNSETRAEEKEGRYFLSGTKWFTSAMTANLAMVLAQTNIDGNDRLSLFLIPIRDEYGRPNNIEILRLKEKLGTKAMPTAELKLKGSEGFLVGKLGEGVRNIATVLNISRLYNSVCATGTILRLHSLLLDYSKKRKAFGKTLIEHPLHQETLLITQADTRGCVHFVSQMAVLLGKSEVDEASDIEKNVLRLMIPIAKLWTAKKAVATTSELIEGFGGAGYIEDTNLPRFLRDSQVFSIWEGTTNIMSLDALRALGKMGDLGSLQTFISKKLEVCSSSHSKERLSGLLKQSVEWVSKNQKNSETLEWGARRLAFALGDLFVGTLMLEFAQASKQTSDLFLADCFIGQIQNPTFSDLKEREKKKRETLFS